MERNQGNLVMFVPSHVMKVMSKVAVTIGLVRVMAPGVVLKHLVLKVYTLCIIAHNIVY